MKKLLGIVVLGLLWCNVGVAEYYEMNKCFPLESTKDGINKFALLLFFTILILIAYGITSFVMAIVQASVSRNH